MMNNIFTFLITLFLCLHQVVAHEGDDHSHCEQALLKAPITIHSSGRDEDMLPELEVAAKKLTQLAKELGFATPPHIMSFVPAVQMNVLASLGRHSAPHWVDGENILRNLGSASNILEFVTRGCDACRSYFSDTNSLKHQISIIMHVLGHNDVSSNSNFHKSVYTDSMGYSKKFAEQVQWLYEHYDHDEVSLYVQWLYSLEYMQNFVFAGFDPPNFFKPTTDNITRVEHLGTKNKAEKTYKSNKHPQRPSANILQALVYNLPSNVPTWKVELLDTFEKSRRYYSGNIATKIMNEGRATFSQYLLARHSDYTTDDDIAQFGGLLYGVAFPKLDNPYYLGLQLWWHLWEQFKNKPEMSKLSAKEIDKLFVSRAHEIISTNDDFSFIDVAIDQKWIDKMKFSLVRPVDSKDKIDRSKIAKPPSNDAKLMVALSRHRERIVRYIQRKVASRQLIFPHVLLEDFNWMNNGIIKLRHEMIEDVPLKMDSSFLSLFVLSQLLEKPIALEAQYDVNYIFIVEPTGKVKVHIKDDKAELDHRNPLGAINQQLTHVGQKIVDEYKEATLDIVNDNYRNDRLNPIWKKSINATIDHQVGPSRSIINYAPHSGSSVWEYHKTVEQILVERVRRMIQNGQQPKTQNGKLMIPVLPPIPYFELDRNVLSILTAKKPPAPIDGGVYDPQQDTGYGQDDNSLLLQSGFLPGEVFWWNGQGQGGDGNGDGDGDGKGDGNGKGRPKKPNGGKSGTGTPDNSPGTPGSVGNGGGEVPIEQAFWGEMLGDTLKLPNIRRTNGESEELTRVRRGSVRKPKGYELDELTLANAMEKAIALRKKRGLPFRIGEFDPSTGEVLNKRKLIREAIPLMDQGDIQVSYFTETPRPDFEAVMVVMGDMTGSMSGLRIELAKQLIFNIQALLKAGYKKITIRYVGFAMNAIEMSEDEFFNSFISGGTSYQSALLKGQEILNEYSNSTHNKYMLLVGDGESFDAHQSANIIRSLYEDLQFFSFAVTSGGHLWAGDFVRTISNLKSEWPWIGVSQLNSHEDVIKALPELFPQTPAKK